MKKIQNYLKKLSGGNSKNNGLLVKGINPFGKKARRSKKRKSTFQISKVNIKERFKHRLLFLCIIVSFIGLSMYGLMGSQNANAGSVACTPDSGFTNCTSITYSGADQTFTVPANVTSINVKVWGAGGGGVDADYWANQPGGASGGYVTGNIAVTPGQTLLVVVGQGGKVGNSTGGSVAGTIYGGGGLGGNETGNTQPTGGNLIADGSTGGGMSGIFFGTKTAPNAQVIAGGGGGASPGADDGGLGGGAVPYPAGGGGLTGLQDTRSDLSGRGGTQSAGGAGATSTAGCDTSATAGSQFQGGTGGNKTTGSTTFSEGGGGGGGGWFGGGGGKCQGQGNSTSSGSPNGNGGGGSSYIGGSAVSGASTTSGNNGVAGTPGQGGAAVQTSQIQYVTPVGRGGLINSTTTNAEGGNGLVVIQYNVNTPDLTISKSHSGNFTIGSTGTYSFTVNNIGTLATSGTITVTDTLPTGLTVNGGAAGGVTEGGTNSADWTCNSNATSPQTITCTSSTAIAISGSSVFNFTVDVGASTAVGTNSITNTATVSGGGQTNTANDSSSDPTTVALPTFSCSSTVFESGGVSDTKVYTINTSNGVLTAVGNFAVGTNAISVQPSTGNIYYYNTTSPSQLYVWNAATGVNTTLGSTFTTNSIVRLAFSPTGRLFASDSTGAAPKLFEINPTTGAVISSGTITFSSGSPSGSGDMAFDSNGVLYFSIGSGLYTVNLTTRVGTLVSTMSASPMMGLAFGGTGTLYGANGGSNNLFSINANTGTATVIGGVANGPSDLGSCAFPTPSLASTKTVAKVAGSGGATTAPGDTLEYTITTTNSGNVPSTLTTLTDAIPTGTTYVASSTKLNGSAVADVSGVMPYVTANSINGVGMNAGVIGSDAGVNNVATVVFRVTVNSSSPPTTVSNQGTINFNNGTQVLTDDPSVGGATDPTVSTITSLPPNIGLVKSCPSPADCTTAAQLPGTDVTYNIAFTNTGGSSAQNMVLVDGIPTNTDYKLGSATSSLGTTGLTIVIEYSSDYDALNPTLATWTYTPVSGGGGADAGYDRLVKAIRWRVASGTLSNVSPNNTGNVSFITKIR